MLTRNSKKGAEAEALRQMYKISRDPSSRVILIETLGFWSPEVVDRYFADLGAVAESDRALGLKLRVLLDKRGSPLHSQETMLRLQDAFIRFYHPGDRVAAILDSSLAKMQFRRVYNGEISQPFLSVSAARLWLSAD